MSDDFVKLLRREIRTADAAVEPISMNEIDRRDRVVLDVEPDAAPSLELQRKPSESFEWLVEVNGLRTESEERSMNKIVRFAGAVTAAAAVVIFAVATIRRDEPTSSATDQSIVNVDIGTWESIEHDGLAWARVPDNAPPAGSVSDSPSTTSPAVPGFVGSPHMDSIAVGGPGLVAVGTNYHLSFGTQPHIWTSPDGLQWQRSTLDPAVFGDSFDDQVQLKAVTAGGPGVVAVGVAGDSGHTPVWISQDGLRWENAEGGFDPESRPRLQSVTAAGPGLVAVGWVTEEESTDAAVWTSEDGMSWSRVAHDPSVFGGPGRQTMTSVVAGGPGLIAVGQDQRDEGENPVAAVWTSPDGRSWSRIPHDESVFGGPHELTATTVAVGGPGLIAAGFESPSSGNRAQPVTGSLWTSVDGFEWHRLPPEDEEVFAQAVVGSVTRFESGLIAVGQDIANQQGRIWTSRDGLHWCSVPHDQALFETTGIAAGVALDSRFIAVGAGYRVEWGSAVWVASLTEAGFTPCASAPSGDN